MEKKINHILLVDDDEDDQGFFTEALGEIDASIHCSIAENGKKALMKLHEAMDLPDIIFMDINMPEINGFDCLKQLKKSSRFQLIPVILLSTSVSIPDKAFASKCGAEMFFTKPCSYRKLRSLLNSVFKSYQ